MKTSYHVMIGVLQIHMSCGELPAATEKAVFVFYGNRQFLIYILQQQVLITMPCDFQTKTTFSMKLSKRYVIE